MKGLNMIVAHCHIDEDNAKFLHSNIMNKGQIPVSLVHQIPYVIESDKKVYLKDETCKLLIESLDTPQSFAVVSRTVLHWLIKKDYGFSDRLQVVEDNPDIVKVFGIVYGYLLTNGLITKKY